MRYFTPVLLSLALLGGVARGGEMTVSSEPFAVSVQREPVNTLEPVFRAYVTVGANKFTFIVPEKFSSGGDPLHGRLQFKTLEGDSVITLVFVRAESGLTSEACRALLAESYPGAKITREYARPVGGQNGLFFDVSWKSASGFAMATRAAYFPTPTGNVQLTVSSGVKKSKEAQLTLNHLLGSLTVSADGKLALQRIQPAN